MEHQTSSSEASLNYSQVTHAEDIHQAKSTNDHERRLDKDAITSTAATQKEGMKGSKYKKSNKAREQVCKTKIITSMTSHIEDNFESIRSKLRNVSDKEKFDYFGHLIEKLEHKLQVQICDYEWR